MTNGDAIVGCANNSNGQLRIVDDASQCRSNEHAVTFAAPGPGPQEVVVDCPSESVNQALEATADAPMVTITIEGTCEEAVTISRNEVTLQGASTSDGLTAPTVDDNVLTLDGAEGIHLESMTVSGGGAGIVASAGSSFAGDALSVDGSVWVGISVETNSYGVVTNTALDGTGIGASNSGSLSFNGGTISNAAVGAGTGGAASLDISDTLITGSTFHGVEAGSGSTIQLSNVTVEDGSGQGVFAYENSFIGLYDGVVIQNNAQGGLGVNGASVAAEQAVLITGNTGGPAVGGFYGATITLNGVIEDNQGDGFSMSGGSTLSLFGATVQDNGGNGISLVDTSITFGNGNDIKNNGGMGVFCAPSPSVAMISSPGPNAFASYSGNGGGDTNCGEA